MTEREREFKTWTGSRERGNAVSVCSVHFCYCDSDGLEMPCQPELRSVMLKKVTAIVGRFNPGHLLFGAALGCRY